MREFLEVPVGSDMKPIDSEPSVGLAPILLVEDLSDDVFFIERALGKAGVPNPLAVVSNGHEAIHYLDGHGHFADRGQYPLPGLLLLDLKMPQMDGFDVLAWLLPQRQFDNMAVVVLSGSELESDIVKAKELGADDYHVKPAGVDGLVALVRGLREKWL